MAASSFNHFTDVSELLGGYDMKITTQHVPLCVVNGIRRFSMNSIPIAGFRDEPPSITDVDKRSIVISKNHSLLYNEMLVTRIAMLPLKQSVMPTIISKWDKDSKQRIHYFERTDNLPIATYEIKSESQAPGLKDVTTDDIVVSAGDEAVASKDFFVNDLTIDSPILLHCLMFPYPSVDVPLAFKGTPVIGTGRENSSFTPVGTTSMKFVVDESRVEDVMKSWMDKKLTERASKGLSALAPEEIENMKKNFMLLERQRVYKQNATGPTHIQLRVESIGSLSSKIIVRESLKMLAVHINDCWKSISESDISQPQKSIIEINLGKIDHTVAQCLVYAWNKMDDFKAKYTMPSYRLIHPLKETMILSLRIVNTSVAPQVKEIMSMLHTCIAICVDDISYLLNEYDTLIPSSHSHTKIADSPDDWILNQSTIPLVSQSILPRRSPRTAWNIAAALLRSGS